MSTELKPELSTKSKYWIERHRYYELKHFCLQYNIWKRIVDTLEQDIESYSSGSVSDNVIVSTTNVSKPTEAFALRKVYYQNRIDMVEQVCKQTEPTLASYLLLAVTNGFSYDILRARTDIPCCREVYYDLYRKFFWLLDKERA